MTPSKSSSPREGRRAAAARNPKAADPRRTGKAAATGKPGSSGKNAPGGKPGAAAPVAAPAPNTFIHTRSRKQNELAEDYVELIDDLIATRGEARIVDIAKALGVSHVTVSKAVNRLMDAGLVHSEPYRSVFLTDAGRALAAEARERHRIVEDFLVALGVPGKQASLDAEGIEHHVSATTLAAMQRFLRGKG